MFEGKRLLVENVAVIEKAARRFVSRSVPHSPTPVPHKHVMVNETATASQPVIRDFMSLTYLHNTNPNLHHCQTCGMRLMVVTK